MNEYISITKSEAEFPKIFANWEERSYGILFFNEENKNSYDSNHAVIYPEKIDNLKDVLQDIRCFYMNKKIKPLVYHPFIQSYFSDNKKYFEEYGYEIKIFEDIDIMVLCETNNIVRKNTIELKLLEQWDERIATDIFIPNEEEYEVEVVKKSLASEGNFLFTGYLGDKAVVTLYLHRAEYGCTRFDYINTARYFRGRGYARELISHVVEFCKENDLPCCYQWPANESSRKICYEAGFRSKYELPNGVAIYTENE